MLFLCETFALRDRVFFVGRGLGFTNWFVVDCEGRRGGGVLVLLWRADVEVQIMGSSVKFIDSQVRMDDAMP